MSYAALVWADFRKDQRSFSAHIDLQAFLQLYATLAQDPRVRIPK